ncbi:MAG: hypothetical protein ACFWUE_11415 [Xylanivirga thermophila]|jgi:stage II sporulation protein M|uniref:stage II sporulation protein M n=1 Tax=Xylanivirga thermophila TaxID=2496273 RepID=UPI0039F461E3
MRQLMRTISLHIQQNFILYLIILFVFLTGIMAGAFTISTISIDQKSGLGNYLEHFVSNISQSPINRTAIFWESIWQNFYICFLFWLSSLSFLLIPLTLVLVGIRGFFIGFTVGFLVGYYNLKGFIFSLLCLIPQMIIYIPCFIIMGVLAFESQISHLKRRKLMRKKMQPIKDSESYTKKLIIIFSLFFIVTLFETFITPLFFSMFSNFLN